MHLVYKLGAFLLYYHCQSKGITMKKSYVKPTMEVVSYDAQTSLLAGSSDESNPYWEGPGEVPEGCQSNWWCGK